MRRYIFLIIVFFVVRLSATGQSNKWSLDACIQYAIGHNIQIKQQALNTKLNETALKQSKLSRLPNLNAGTNYSFSTGRVLDMTTYRFTNNSVNYMGTNVGTNVNLFNGLKTNNTIKQNKYRLMASMAELDRVKNNISMNIALAYLQILLDKELLTVAQEQVGITKQQIDHTRKLVDAGSLPMGNLLEIEAQEASEEMQVVSNSNALDIAYLNLTQILDLDSVGGFDIMVPEIENPDSNFVIPKVADVFADALNIMPQIKSAGYQLKSSELALKIAKGSRSPRLNLSGSFNTSFSDNRKKVLGVDPVGVIIYGEYPFLDQLGDNRNWGIGLGLSIPIFNNWQVEQGVSNAKINIENAQLQLQNEKNQLYKEIQQAYADARAALKKYLATKKTVSSMRESFRYTSQKFNVGLVTSVDYNTAKNQLAKARSDMLGAKYEFIFKVNVLNFYRGKPFDLNLKL